MRKQHHKPKQTRKLMLRIVLLLIVALFAVWLFHFDKSAVKAIALEGLFYAMGDRIIESTFFNL